VQVERPERRLRGFWGAVDRKHNAAMRAHVAEGPVLDVGCGYGTLTTAITRDDGLACVGVDLDEASLAVARARCPECRFEHAGAATLPFGDASFTTIVLRDALHHLVNEPDWPATGRELRRVMRPGGRVVVLDPNITAILRLGQRLARHEDEACTVERAAAELGTLGFEVTHTEFNTLFSLPASGGYVGVKLVPDWPWLHRLLLSVEAGLERVLRPTGLPKRLAWRYLLIAERR
jgi:SAM-dependent methyltransferase